MAVTLSERAATHIKNFLAKRGKRLLLSVSFDEPAAGAFAGLDRPHTHDYTALAVSGARAADGTLRLAATGAGSWGARLPSAEAAAGDPAAAGEAAKPEAGKAEAAKKEGGKAEAPKKEGGKK